MATPRAYKPLPNEDGLIQRSWAGKEIPTVMRIDTKGRLYL